MIARDHAEIRFMTTLHAGAEPRLRHLPVAFFSMVMGLAGLTLATGRAQEALGLSSPTPLALAWLSATAFAALAVLHLLRWARFPDAVRADFAHPVKLHFFPTVSISLLLLSAAFAPHAPAVARALFIVGAPLHLILTLAVLSMWFNRTDFQPAHLNPAWFIPIVGNVVVPIAATPLGHVEIAWFFFSVGIVFWIVLFAVILNRVLFHAPPPDRLAPTVFILIAPPAVGFLAWVRLTGEIDAFARVLYYFGLFVTLFLAIEAPRLLRLPFFLSWWAYSFPLAAITTATWVMVERVGGSGFEMLASALSATLVMAVAGLLWRTGVAIARGEICRPE
jgi:tellurite resistance protein